MESDNLLLLVAVVAVVIAMVGVGVTYNSLNVFSNLISGNAVESGLVQLNISSNMQIEIISANGSTGSKTLDWGTGTVDASETALLVSNGTVTNSNFPVIDSGFIIENTGNVNVTLSLHASKDASGFFSVPEGESLFQYNLTNYEPGSCVFSAETEGVWKNFTTTSTPVCTTFTYDTGDKIRLDILMSIPSSASPGSLTNTITLTYEEAE